MTFCNMILLIIVGFISGVISGCFAIDSAIILSPLLLSHKMNPKITLLTTSFIQGFGSLSSSILVLFFGRINSEYFGILVLMSLFGSSVGLVLQYQIAKR